MSRNLLPFWNERPMINVDTYVYSGGTSAGALAFLGDFASLVVVLLDPPVATVLSVSLFFLGLLTGLLASPSFIAAEVALTTPWGRVRVGTGMDDSLLVSSSSSGLRRWKQFATG